MPSENAEAGGGPVQPVRNTPTQPTITFELKVFKEGNIYSLANQIDFKSFTDMPSSPTGKSAILTL